MTKDSFLPDKYEMPEALTGYMKFKPGENKFRVLSSAIVGYETWTEDKEGNRKPTRFKMGEKIPVDKVGTDPKHFWAFVVWNYSEEKVQVLEITQKGIMKSIQSLVSDEDWGDPNEYDIVVTREGEGLDTEYQVNPKPKKELDSGIVRFYKDLKINLDALFEGKDPFKSGDEIEAEKELK
jgi:hypothetical protein